LRDRRISGNEYKTRGLENLGKPLDLSGLNGERMTVPFQNDKN
jgi:hypothetical protein